MSCNIVANRYAKALFFLGREAGPEKLQAFGSSLGGLGEAYSVSPPLALVLCSPLFSVDEKRKTLQSLGKKLSTDDTVLNFCYLLAEKKRMDMLPAIVSAFNALLDEENNVVRGEVLTAVALDEKKQQSVLKALGKKTDSTLELEFGVDPEILGGVMLKVGDKVLDASLRAQLSILKDSIKRGE